MPELPEVETTRLGLDKTVLNKEIQNIEVFDPRVVRNQSIKELKSILNGHQFVQSHRLGKYLALETDHRKFLLVHLRMTGQLIYGCPNDKSRLRISFKGEHVLDFVDQRRFGEIWCYDDWMHHSGVKKLGPDPFCPGFSESWFVKALAEKKTKIKALLLDQEFVAGLGNIYVNEALFQAKIHPERAANTISSNKAKKLYSAIYTILEKAIACGGSSIRNYVNISGSLGSFQLTYSVYGRQGQPCPSCQNILIHQKIAGRGTVYCPRCQA